MRCLTWMARMIAAGLLCLVAALAWGEDLDWSRRTTAERTVGAAFLVLILGNLLIACPPWTADARRQGVGALLSLLGLTAFYLANYSFSGRWPSGWVLPAFGVPAVLLLFAKFASRIGASESGSRDCAARSS